jgi:hypothetical protein
MKQMKAGKATNTNVELRERALKLSVEHGDCVWGMLASECSYKTSSILVTRLGITSKGRNKYGEPQFQDFLTYDHYVRIDNALRKLEKGLAEGVANHPTRRIRGH